MSDERTAVQQRVAQEIRERRSTNRAAFEKTSMSLTQILEAIKGMNPVDFESYTCFFCEEPLYPTGGAPNLEQSFEDHSPTCLWWNAHRYPEQN